MDFNYFILSSEFSYLIPTTFHGAGCFSWSGSSGQQDRKITYSELDRIYEEVLFHLQETSTGTEQYQVYIRTAGVWPTSEPSNTQTQVRRVLPNLLFTH